MELKTLISEEAGRVDEVMRQDIDGLAADFDPLLIEILNYALFAGGKRIRPFLTILAARFCGCRDEGVYRLATSFEYLHAATLIHDDVIDNANERRGSASVVNRFGLAEAILAGDFLHAHSMELVSRFGGPGALKVFCQATAAMVDGEFLQLRNGRNLDQTEDDYFRVVRGKTALLIGAACEIGGIYGSADETVRSGLKSYGINLGCAFQIIDDLLDYRGDPGKTGKRVGNDLAEGKLTLPLIYALQRASEQDRASLLLLLEDEQKRRQGLAHVSAIIERYHGFTDAGKKAAGIIDQAMAALPDFADDQAAEERGYFQDLCSYILTREK